MVFIITFQIIGNQSILGIIRDNMLFIITFWINGNQSILGIDYWG